MSTITITKGKGFTAISFEKPIEELKQYIFNGEDFFNNVDLSKVKTFWDKAQTLDIYNGRQLIYSCCMKKIGINGKWKRVLLNAWSDEGEVYNYEDGYRRLLESIR